MANSVELPPSIPPHTVTTKSYCAAIQAEARYVNQLGPSATADKFLGAYNGLLGRWFPSSRTSSGFMPLDQEENPEA
jgi:hypothetical protein